MDEFLEENIIPVGTNIQPQARIVINNVLMFLTELKEDPEKLHTINFKQAHDLTAMICGVSSKTVEKIKWECSNDGQICPPQNLCQPRAMRDTNDFEKRVIMEIVTSFHSNGEYPTVTKILGKAKERIDGFKCSRNSMQNILKDLGYKNKTAPDGRSQIMERSHISCDKLINRKLTLKKPHQNLSKGMSKLKPSDTLSLAHSDSDCDED